MRRERGKVRQKAEANSGSVITGANLYVTWYQFKKDLERQLGYSLLNWSWLEAKPKAPLPWHESHMRAALSEVARFRRVGGGTKDGCPELAMK